MPDPAPQPASQAPPPSAAAPGLVALFEQSLHGIVSPAVFRAAAARPAPSFGATGGLIMASGAAAVAVSLAHATVENPDLFQRYSPPVVAAVGVAALGLYASVNILTALMLFGLGSALGGKGDFHRGLQAAAMLSVFWPLQMMCNWFPVAWALPCLLAAWSAASALEGLFGAKPGLARALCALGALSALGAQLAGRAVAERARQAYAATQALTQAANSGGDLAKQMEAFQKQADAAMAAGDASAVGAVPGAAPAVGTSGLDLLKGPSDDSPAQAPAPPSQLQQAQKLLQNGKEVQASVMGMIDSLEPMLNNPEITKNMSPEQKSSMKELRGLIADLRGQIKSGQRLSDQEFDQKMKHIQQLTMQMMMAGAAQNMFGARPPAPAPAPGADRPHLKLPGNGK
jgi:hypothetical protein